jgi:hypothetical protein
MTLTAETAMSLTAKTGMSLTIGQGQVTSNESYATLINNA